MSIDKDDFRTLTYSDLKET